ncbi:SDR family oxidoreductase [Mycobacterium sp. 1274756.6]|uniref:SDR family oxidoreductase n=1 Tax=Mycobacterium sp. 1274756.6 TaxID=1834076 RepID=UPI0008023676|nr:SDR family oxidoreductase [Mycobacterium sp. 1274756.6]OBJ68020.1 short-chain dehydrogenase [Mycobacterium sp. 1274756.6]
MATNSPENSRILAPDVLKGQVCVVSGAGTGLGRAAALELARGGAAVIGCGRRADPLAETVSMIEEIGGTAQSESLDIREPDAVDAFIDRVVGEHGHIDTMVNNAVGQFGLPAEMITPNGFRKVLETNILGTWLMTHAVATKAMIPQGGGRILNVTLSPHDGFPGLVHSSAARAAVENMTKTLSIEWARFGIRLNALAAGHFDTNALSTRYVPGVKEDALTRVPAGRFGTEEEWGWLVAFLASPAGDYFNGSVLTLDGARDVFGAGPYPPPGFLEAVAAARAATGKDTK